ncbi:hypothetical protein AHiyo6_20110 [Arthrobacter sp. Hiyo6]|nr:hypothetical protein AHiyo6_20110 [Arthrobacter sp. Hiyo6]
MPATEEPDSGQPAVGKPSGGDPAGEDLLAAFYNRLAVLHPPRPLSLNGTNSAGGSLPCSRPKAGAGCWRSAAEAASTG